MNEYTTGDFLQLEKCINSLRLQIPGNVGPLTLSARPSEKLMEENVFINLWAKKQRKKKFVCEIKIRHLMRDQHSRISQCSQA